MHREKYRGWYNNVNNDMSGHSKWATIHRQKGVNDAKKGAIFTKLARSITMAVREGRGLPLALAKARQFNMPKENIARAIDRGSGLAEGEELHEVMFEGFAPGGIAVIVMAVTDNKLRTGQQVRGALDKGGGSLASQGAVSYLFSYVGEIIAVSPKPLEEAELEVIDLGVTDVEEEGDRMIIYCDKDKTFETKEKLDQMGYTVEAAELAMRPVSHVVVNDEATRAKVEEILERLDDLDDVQKVWTNYA